MKKIKNKISSEELSEMQNLSRVYNQVRLKVAELSMQHYQALRNMEAIEARMSKFNQDVTEKYNLTDESKIDPQTGEIK